MGLNELILNAVWLEPASGLVIDFTLAFIFFTALCFAVLVKRFDHRRSAAAMAAALGASLALGLVAWEVQSGWRIQSLGPVAAGLALLVLAAVIHQAIRRIGGDWAGAAIALGAAAMIGTVLNMPWPIADRTVGAVAVLILILGAGMWWLHHTPSSPSNLISRFQGDRRPALAAFKNTRRQVHDLDDVRRLERQLDRSMDELGQQVRKPDDSPSAVAAIRQKLNEMIPAEGVLTRRLADLRSRAVFAERGHLARLRKLTAEIPKMTPEQARQAAMQVRQAYKAAGFYRRIERLDAAAVQAERKIQRLTAQAEAYANIGQTKPMQKLIEDATKLQHQVDRLFSQIERDERKLLGLVAAAANKAMASGGDGPSR